MRAVDVGYGVARLTVPGGKSEGRKYHRPNSHATNARRWKALMEKVITNLNKIEVIVAANFAHDYPEVAMEVRSLVQEALQELSLLTQRGADIERLRRLGSPVVKNPIIHTDSD